ncbi:MAG: DNA primase [Gammaproteobacteria bacterium]|nr:DNA primase [Gammaproteobacteria bacterium]MBU1732825.1 DNA primase [Gammaproteobacteria bacterium]MBU1891650.1 DNA primase [Gammaproteobacteria bacterium]
MSEIATVKEKAKPFRPMEYAAGFADPAKHASDLSVLWSWTGTHWAPVEDNQGEANALKWLVRHDSNHATPANAKSAHRAAVLWANKLVEPRRDRVILPLQNGYLRLDGTGYPVLTPHDPAEGLQHCIKCDYMPDASDPVQFQKFLDKILPDKAVQKRVQEYVGYSLIHDARHQLAQLWIGGGMNGKGVLANVVQALHSKVAAVQLDRLEGFALSGMVGASLIYCDEAPKRGIDEQAIKTLIAGETIQIDRKYRDPLSVRIQGKWIVLANHIPAIADQSHGFWRRWDVIPFDTTIAQSESIAGLADILIAEELHGILNWALAGLLGLLTRGYFDREVPESVLAAKQAGQLESNSVAAWFKDADMAVVPDMKMPKADVYAEYVAWCRDNGMSPLAMPRFWPRVQTEHPDVTIGRAHIGAARVYVCNLAAGIIPREPDPQKPLI